MNMVVEGYSCFGSFGTVKDLAKAIRQPSPAPVLGETDTSALSDYFSPRSLRQCDRFSRLALLGASLALADAGLSPKDAHTCGIILSTGYGPASPTFDFLDSLLNFGEGMASPLAFSHSVHNIPAAIVAKNLEIVGPCATVCQFDSAVASGLMLASGWLAEGRVERIIFGAVDEYTALLETITDQLRQERTEDGCFSCRRNLPLGEGAAFFILGAGKSQRKGRIQSVSVERSPEGFIEGIEDTGMRFVSGAFSSPAADTGVHDGNLVFGNLPIGLALTCASALHMMHEPGAESDRALCLNYGSGTRSAVALARD